jgi:hypothetical protein
MILLIICWASVMRHAIMAPSIECENLETCSNSKIRFFFTELGTCGINLPSTSKIQVVLVFFYNWQEIFTGPLFLDTFSI